MAVLKDGLCHVSPQAICSNLEKFLDLELATLDVIGLLIRS